MWEKLPPFPFYSHCQFHSLKITICLIIYLYSAWKHVKTSWGLWELDCFTSCSLHLGLIFVRLCGVVFINLSPAFPRHGSFSVIKQVRLLEAILKWLVWKSPKWRSVSYCQRHLLVDGSGVGFSYEQPFCSCSISSISGEIWIHLWDF